ncbi:MAG: bifunctional 4-hydroxy-2-oxoglutarate aldolase/2-dehydro-3-deoxy-phosphogluconate aldolase [Ruminococcaceae bacterium]|nr:bifunctional 4-hydroxy-2-oxoglutarate aldolase/2-dehydro-3-deoxy-phosphogluconate aldolase [Oscillospiraceae bacterium]
MERKIIEQIEKYKIITIVRGVAKEKLIHLAEAMYEGGIRLVECTYDMKGNVSDEETASYIKMLSSHFGDKMVVGAGTVLTEKQVELTREAGGKFIISPDTNVNIIKKTKQQGLVSIPGALTPSEIAMADRAGADFVKVFPVNLLGGPSYIKTISAPLSNVRLLAVNGVSAGNMTEYLEAGACGVGIGSGVVNKAKIDAGDFKAITELAKLYTCNL